MILIVQPYLQIRTTQQSVRTYQFVYQAKLDVHVTQDLNPRIAPRNAILANGAEIAAKIALGLVTHTLERTEAP